MFGRFKKRNNLQPTKNFNGRVNLLEKNDEKLDPYLQKFMNGSSQPEYMKGRRFKKAPLETGIILARTKDQWKLKESRPKYGEDIKYYTRAKPRPVKSRISEHLLYWENENA